MNKLGLPKKWHFEEPRHWDEPQWIKLELEDGWAVCRITDTATYLNPGAHPMPGLAKIVGISLPSAEEIAWAKDILQYEEGQADVHDP